MSTESKVTRALLPLSRIMALIAGYALLALSLLIALEILLRRFANMSLQGSDEMGGYVLAILAAFGFSYALLERAHTRVEILVERVPGRMAAALNLLALVGIMVMALFIAWRGWAALAESIDYKSLSGTPLMTPLWMPQSVWVAGLLFFAVVSTIVTLHAAYLFVTNWPLVNRLYGIKSLEEIMDEEQVDGSTRRERKA
ncbi:TRAP transporter small permease subunit [Pseudooceanicola nanhaiensis]|uniref:TRAP transporter small permease subunit n=1 Tax=Pseudooceanicola nanhaiensis TaxID=375761 RepID=UPI001CD79272|nr:TRAP transporter small permease [Pseudooceanicola nanhaiensis]MCA0922641.1 TRAP transporter small permease [Pseudooceanicola nanhaiensis]